MSETRKLGKESKCVCWVWQDGGPDFQKQLVGGGGLKLVQAALGHYSSVC